MSIGTWAKEFFLLYWMKSKGKVKNKNKFRLRLQNVNDRLSSNEIILKIYKWIKIVLHNFSVFLIDFWVNFKLLSNCDRKTSKKIKASPLSQKNSRRKSLHKLFFLINVKKTNCFIMHIFNWKNLCDFYLKKISRQKN